MKKCNAIKGFQECLISVAQQCAEGADIHTTWHDFLLSILTNWDADIQMDLHEAVVIMLSAAGLNESVNYKGFLFYTLPMRLGIKLKIDFGFKLPAELRSLPESMQSKKKIFMMTIAIFETINYWCSYYWYHIVFNREFLIDVLENDSINIDWTSYLRAL